MRQQTPVRRKSLAEKEGERDLISLHARYIVCNFHTYGDTFGFGSTSSNDT